MNRVKVKYRKRRILLKQNNKCNICKKELEESNFCLDHIKPLGFGGSNDEENLQVLCINCHSEKTKRENYCK